MAVSRLGEREPVRSRANETCSLELPAVARELLQAPAQCQYVDRREYIVGIDPDLGLLALALLSLTDISQLRFSGLVGRGPDGDCT
jgi:hypothetical protein